MASAPDPQTSSAARRFRYGLTLPLTGMRRMVTDRALLPLTLAPTAVAALLLGTAWWWAFDRAPDLVALWFDRPRGSGWLHTAWMFGWTLASVVVHLAVLAVASVVAWITAGIIASPLYDQLSSAVEAQELGPAAEGFALRKLVGDVAQGITHSLMALTLYLALACPLVVLGLVPVLGQAVELVAGTALSAFFLAREVLDFPLSRRRLSFMGKLAFLRDHAPQTLGLGLTTFALLWVPGANLLLMPAAVVGATLLYCDLVRSGSLDHLA